MKCVDIIHNVAPHDFCQARKISKITLTFVVSVRLSALKSAPTGRIFMKFKICVFFEYLSRKLKFHQTLTKIKGSLYYMETNTHSWSYLTYFFSKCELVQAKVVEKIKTHVLCSILFFFRKSCLFVMWKNNTEPGRPQTIIWRMRTARYLSLKTYTQYTQYLFSSPTMVVRTRFHGTF